MKVFYRLPSGLFLLTIILCLLVANHIVVNADSYTPDPIRPPTPANKPALIYPYSDPAITLVKGFGTDTHNDDDYLTHPYYAMDFGYGNFFVLAAAPGRLTHDTWTTKLDALNPDQRVDAGCVEDIDPRLPNQQGRAVVIDHGDGWKTVYYHLQLYLTDNDVEVQAGDYIGISGCSGSYWKHLHFELRNYSVTHGTWSYEPQFYNLR